MSTMVAMDCTIGNGDPQLPHSLHYMHAQQATDDEISIGGVTSRSAKTQKSRIVENVSFLSKMVKQAKGIKVELDKTAKSDFNEYQEALYLCMSVLEAYDNDRHIPFLGFGAKLPPSHAEPSNCFALNGNIF